MKNRSNAPGSGVFALVLALVLSVSLVPVGAIAFATNDVHSQSSQEEVTAKNDIKDTISFSSYSALNLQSSNQNNTCADVTAAPTIHAVCARAVTSSACTLTYDANGGFFADGAMGRSEDKALTDGLATFDISSTNPYRNGYTFKGWADSSQRDVVKYTSDGVQGTSKQITITRNTTIHAVWERLTNPPTPPTPTEYKVTVKYINEDGQEVKNSVSVPTTDGGKYDVTDKKDASIDGYAFKEVKDDSPALSGTTDKDIEIVLVYTKKQPDDGNNSGPKPDPNDPMPPVDLDQDNDPSSDPKPDIPSEDPPIPDEPQVKIPEQVEAVDLNDAKDSKQGESVNEPETSEDIENSKDDASLISLPQTGDILTLWYLVALLVALLSSAGILAFHCLRRKSHS